MRQWLFQANPKHYRVDAALAELEQIWWRCPQYTTEIEVGDVALIWRAGKGAGIIGVGRVASPPQHRGADVVDQRFVISTDELAGDATQVLLAVRPTEFVSKEQFEAIPELSDHRIVTAPMGTVFPLTDEQWAALSSRVAEPPRLDATGLPSLVPTFAWKDRASGVLPMPGGYDGYLASTRRVLALVDQARPTPEELTRRISEEFGVTLTAARLRESFLRKVGIVAQRSGSCVVSDWSQRWLDEGRDEILVSLLHRRCSFIGEMLDALREPKSVADLLRVAEARYDLHWETDTQINNRRGWLQSAGCISAHDGLMHLTAQGADILSRLSLYEPPVAPRPLPPPPPPPPLPFPTDSTGPGASPTDGADADAATPALVAPADTSARLSAEIEAAAIDSENPRRFEVAVRDAFAFLGFDAELLGGAGKTDVLLDAPLGKGESYRVAVDAKTSGKGAVTDTQIDWVTLRDHRALHEADHSLVVAPNPTPGRLTDRAAEYRVAIMSARQLAGLCRQHARSPLGLHDYKALFTAAGSVDTTDLDERADDLARLMALAGQICATLATDTADFGRLTARDLWISLARTDAGSGSTVDEIRSILTTLASPLIAAIYGDPDHGYVLATDPRVTMRRLELLGTRIAEPAAAVG